MRLLGLFAFWLISINAQAQAFQPSVEIIEQFDDVRLVAFVDEKDLENYPQWNPLHDAPPLSINKAIQSVSRFYKVNNAHSMSNAIKEIELRTIPKHQGLWHYLIKVKLGNNSSVGYQVYVVLMNGKVIPAMIETESYK